MNDFELLADRGNKKIYRDGDKRIKIFESGYTKDMILLEAYNQSVIENTTINSYPACNTHVIGVGAFASGSYSKASFLVISYVEAFIII